MGSYASGHTPGVCLGGFSTAVCWCALEDSLGLWCWSVIQQCWCIYFCVPLRVYRLFFSFRSFSVITAVLHSGIAPAVHAATTTESRPGRCVPRSLFIISSRHQFAMLFKYILSLPCRVCFEFSNAGLRINRTQALTTSFRSFCFLFPSFFPSLFRPSTGTPSHLPVQNVRER